MTVTNSSDERIAALTRRWRRSSASRCYEPFEVLYEIPISIVFGRARPRQLLLVTKNSLLQRIYDDLHRFPADWVIVCRPGMPGEAHSSEIAALAKRFHLPVSFVGDISPYDVHVFLEYRRLLAISRAPIHWAGIRGDWLRECGRRLGGSREGGVFADLAPIEHQHRDNLERCTSSVSRLVGEEVWAVLRSGKKLTLESASGVAAYGPDIHRAIVRSLRVPR